MKTLRALSISFGAATLLFGAAAGQASAGENYARGWGLGWGAYPSDVVSGGYGTIDGGPCGYGACGLGSCPPGASVLWSAGYPHCDYARYIVGHGPMYPGGDNATGYSYSKPAAPNTPPAANRP